MIQPNILPKYNDTISAILKILPIPIYYDTPNIQPMLYPNQDAQPIL